MVRSLGRDKTSAKAGLLMQPLHPKFRIRLALAAWCAKRQREA
jgi:hypothetical protein